MSSSSTSNTSIFQQLIGSLDTTSFFEDYWEKKIYHLKQNEYISFDDILSLEQLDGYLQQKSFTPPQVRVVNKQNPSLAQEAYTPEKAEIPNQKLFNALNNGCSIIINSLESQLPSFGDFCTKLSGDLGFAIEANIYITPPNNAQGFNIHFDHHHVLVLQLHGEKIWNFYDHVVQYPTLKWMRSNSINQTQPSTGPKSSIKLQKGDLLYVPRGLQHEAITPSKSTEPSIHITFGIYPKMWYELFHQLANQAMNIETFRQALPPNFSKPTTQDQFKRAFKQELLQFVENLDMDKVLQAQKVNFDKQLQPSLDGKFLNFIKVNKIQLDTILEKRSNITYKTTINRPYFEIHLEHQTLTFPLPLQTIIESVLASSSISVQEIGGKIANKLKLDYAKQLVSAGLMKIR